MPSCPIASRRLRPASRWRADRRNLAPAVVAAASLAGLVMLPAAASADEPTLDEVVADPTAVPPEGTGSRLVWTGVGLAAGWYGASLGASFFWQDAPARSDWRIPVVGPWMALDDVRCGSGEGSCGDVVLTIRTAITLIASVGQIGGLFAITEGLLLDTSSSESSPSAVSPSAVREPRWMAVPVARPDGAGFQIIGEF